MRTAPGRSAVFIFERDRYAATLVGRKWPAIAGSFCYRRKFRKSLNNKCIYDILDVFSHELLHLLELPMKQHITAIDLRGVEGNAYTLLACARRLALEAGLPSDVVIAEMQGGDYEHLLEVFKRWFDGSILLIH